MPVRHAVEVHGRRLYVEWDPHAPATPLGQLVYFVPIRLLDETDWAAVPSRSG